MKRAGSPALFICLFRSALFGCVLLLNVFQRTVRVFVGIRRFISFGRRVFFQILIEEELIKIRELIVFSVERVHVVRAGWRQKQHLIKVMAQRVSWVCGDKNGPGLFQFARMNTFDIRQKSVSALN